jgi:NADH:ubiquinone oxidoreductase subunit
MAEPSKVPPLWHAWLHYMTDQFPNKKDITYEWQQDFVPNLTGTSFAYFPKGHPNKGGKTPKKWYKPWMPN